MYVTASEMGQTRQLVRYQEEGVATRTSLLLPGREQPRVPSHRGNRFNFCCLPTGCNRYEVRFFTLRFFSSNLSVFQMLCNSRFIIH